MITDKIELITPGTPDPNKIYLDSYQNITQEMIEACKESNKTYQQVVADIKKNALNCMKSDLRAKLGKVKNWFDLVDSFKFTGVVYEDEVTINAAQWYGQRIAYAGSDLQVINFKEAMFVSNITTTATIKVFDLFENKELTSQNINVAIGQNRVNLNYTFTPTYPNGFLFVAIKFDAQIKPLRFLPQCKGKTISMVSAETASATPTKDNIVESDQSLLNISLDVTSNFDNVIELYSNELVLALAYKCVVELYRYTLGTKKASRWELVNRDSMDIAMQDYEKEYNKELTNKLEIIYNVVRQHSSLGMNPETRPSVYIQSR